MLALLLAIMLPGNFLVVDSTGPVFFDAELIAYVALNNTEAAIRLPMVPGDHIVKTIDDEFTVNLFDVECSTEGIFECNFTGHADLEMPFQMSCGANRVGKLLLSDGETEHIAVDGDCDTALLKVGDYREEIPFTRVFTNYISFEGERDVQVLEGDRVILEKFGREYVGFPELMPGDYWVQAGELEGKLKIRPIGTGAYGYTLSAVLVMATIALLWMG